MLPSSELFSLDESGLFPETRLKFNLLVPEISTRGRFQDQFRLVQSKSDGVAAKLVNSGEHDINLELLKLFIMDLLGVNSSAAKIFVTKFDEK